MTKLEELKAALDAARLEELRANYDAATRHAWNDARAAAMDAADAAWYAYKDEYEKQKDKNND
tara:strand:+ start:2458 stop:2646 length:189 start_codon:yes stop_codon:yes gene_type:complete